MSSNVELGALASHPQLLRTISPQDPPPGLRLSILLVQDHSESRQTQDNQSLLLNIQAVSLGHGLFSQPSSVEELETKVSEADKTQLSNVNHQLLWSLLTSQGGSSQSLSSGLKPNPDSHWERKRPNREERKYSMLEDACVRLS